MNTLVACGFVTKAVVTPLGFRTAYSLALIPVGSRRVFLSPATYHPHDGWVEQQARNVLMWLDECNIEPRFILRDRDTKYSRAFDLVLQNTGMRRLRTPVRPPDANAFAEAWIGAIKQECLNHFMCFSLRHLDQIGREHVRYVNEHRPHQGLDNQMTSAAANGPPTESP